MVVQPLQLVALVPSLCGSLVITFFWQGCHVAVIKLHSLCEAIFLDTMEGNIHPSFQSASLHTDETWSSGSDWFGKFWFILESYVGTVRRRI